MTFGVIPPTVEAKLRAIVAADTTNHRKYENLALEWRVRTKHGLRVIKTEAERMRFLLLVLAELNPDNPISQAIVSARYDGTLQNLHFISSDTILRDNRDLETFELFPKAETAKPTPKIVQATLI